MISYGNPEPNNVSEQFICRLRYKTEQAELKAIKKRVLGKRRQNSTQYQQPDLAYVLRGVRV
jgi:hypothetical protein